MQTINEKPNLSPADTQSLRAVIEKAKSQGFQKIVMRVTLAEWLLDELEAKEEQRANWFQMAEKLGADLDAAEKLNADYRARLDRLERKCDHQNSVYWDASNVKRCARCGISVAAGITVKGE
ncbi:hypothetical protein [Lelliottia wanjuensis]|uniref:hypothetical protein n=1 Tax=Lelliottia wanjuensis TaxID=3050585 RepID=UPI00254F397F|nr:hypothetical protein [Lelliottia sp. V86_10]MDK9583179.1 hypothetical protein [Lelliottia sp. V86_10]